MMNRRFAALIIIAFSAWFLPLLFADTIVLKSGKSVEGEIVEETDEFIKLDFYGIYITYYLDEIKTIKRRTSADNLTGDVAKEYAFHFIRGSEYFASDQLDKALPHLKKAVELNSDSLPANIAAGVVSRYLKHYNASVLYLMKANELDPNNSAIYLELGYVYYDGFKDLEKAKYCFEKTIELNPNTRFAYAPLVKIYRSLKEFDKAEKLLQKARTLPLEE